MQTPTPHPPPLHLPAGWTERPPDPGAGGSRVTDLGRLLIGLTVVAVGVLYLLDGADVLDAGRAIDHWWPSLIVAAGLLTLAERPPALARGAILVGIGAVLLLFTTDLLEDSAWKYVWPVLVIAAGVAIVARWSGRSITGAAPDDVLRSTAVFGGAKQASASKQFRGAWLTAIFGGVTLDLRDAELAPEGASVNATAAFGGIDILVPKGWRIAVRSTPIFGGLDDKTDHSVPPADDAPTLRIDAVLVFGGVDVKHKK